MALYDIYEIEGAVFRKPAEQPHMFVTEIYLHGEWRPYTGDRQRPMAFGDFVHTIELEA